MWEIVTGIFIMILGICMIITALILFFAFGINGWYIVFLAIGGVALLVVGMLLWAIIQNGRNNTKLHKESEKKYIIANPELLQEQARQQRQLIDTVAPPALNDDNYTVSNNSVGFSGNNQSENIAESGSDLLSTDSDSSSNTSNKPKPNIVDDEESLFEF